MNTKEYQELMMQNYEDIKRLENELEVGVFKPYKDDLLILDTVRYNEIKEEIKHKHSVINMMGCAIIMGGRVKWG